jgi:hypothetical protein
MAGFDREHGPRMHPAIRPRLPGRRDNMITGRPLPPHACVDRRSAVPNLHNRRQEFDFNYGGVYHPRKRPVVFTVLPADRESEMCSV